MQLTTKFELNQRVWAIDNGNFGSYTPECSICDNTGKVKLKGEELWCPKCRGASVKPKWTIQKSDIVVQINLTRTAAMFSKEWDNRNSYMLGKTGEGIVWPEDRLFASEQAAISECDQRNSLLEAK